MPNKDAHTRFTRLSPFSSRTHAFYKTITVFVITFLLFIDLKNAMENHGIPTTVHCLFNRFIRLALIERQYLSIGQKIYLFSNLCWTCPECPIGTNHSVCDSGGSAIEMQRVIRFASFRKLHKRCNHGLVYPCDLKVCLSDESSAEY
jgi:hypothetical protein